MVKIKLVFSLLIIILLFMKVLTAQNLLKQRPNILKKSVNINEFKPVKYTKKNALFEKKTGDVSEYYLTEINDDTEFSKSKKEKLFSFHKNDSVKYVRFSKSGDQVIYRKSKNGKKIWKVHDIQTKESKIIESNEGSINRASVYDFNNILYRVILKTDRPKIYLIKDNKEPIFIGNGSGIRWSIDKKYFMYFSYQNDDLSLFEKKRYGKISKQEYINQRKAQGKKKKVNSMKYVICSSDGKKILTFDDVDLAYWINWAPCIKKIALRESGDKGFKVIYLNIQNESDIEIERTYHFPGFSNLRSGLSEICVDALWSPDSEKLLIITEVDDGNKVLHNNAYILEDQSYQYYPLIESSDVFLSNVEWISKNSIFFNAHDKNTKINDAYQLIIE